MQNHQNIIRNENTRNDKKQMLKSNEKIRNKSGSKRMKTEMEGSLHKLYKLNSVKIIYSDSSKQE